MSESAPYYDVIKGYFFMPTTTTFKDLAYVYLNKWSHKYWIAPVNVSKKKTAQAKRLIDLFLVS